MKTIPPRLVRPDERPTLDNHTAGPIADERRILTEQELADLNARIARGEQ